MYIVHVGFGLWVLLYNQCVHHLQYNIVKLDNARPKFPIKELNLSFYHCLLFSVFHNFQRHHFFSLRLK
jgi:chloramphenicol O-acetyltransferase